MTNLDELATVVRDRIEWREQLERALALVHRIVLDIFERLGLS